MHLTELHRWAHYPTVCAKYSKDWEPVADHWAFYGRATVWGMDVNTNNHLERWFGIFKYMFLHGKKLAQLAQLISLLLDEVMPHYERDRIKKVVGLEQSSSTAVVERQQREVQHLIQQGWIQIVPNSTLGMYTCRSLHQDGVIFQGCLAELSCSCPFQGICKHLQAAAQVAAQQQQPFCHNLRLQAAGMLVQLDALQQFDSSSGICYCRPLWDISYTESDVIMNITSGYCSCLDWRHHGVCAHLLAAAQHPILSVHHQQTVTVAVPAAEIRVVRTVAAPILPVGMEEPSSCLHTDGQQGFKQIAAAVARARAQRPSSKLTEQQKELSNTVRGIQSCIQFASAELCAECLPEAKEILRKLKAAVPTFKQVNTRAGDVGCRKHTDRTHKSLLARSKGSSSSYRARQQSVQQQQHHAGSGSSSAAVRRAVKAVKKRLFEGTSKASQHKQQQQQQQQQQQRFAKVKQQGAPKRTFRKLGNFTTRARKTTGPKRIPRQQRTDAEEERATQAVSQAQAGKGKKRKADVQSGTRGSKKAAQ